MKLPAPPDCITVGMRVQERKKDGRTGTVLEAAGLRKWVVQFDGEDGTEVKSSGGALRIYTEAYPKRATPKKSLATSVQPAPPKTGRARKAGTKIAEGSGSSSEGSVENSSDDDNAFPGTESVASSDSSEEEQESFSNSSSSGGHSDTDSSSPLHSKRSRKKKKSLLLSAKKVFSQRRRGGRKKGASLQGTRLFTPRPLSEDDSLSSRSIPCDDNGVFTPEEGEGFDDAFEEEEDDNGMGDARMMQDSDAPDGARVEFIDCPQKSALYHAAKKKMEKEKETLINKKHTIRVEVNTKHAYKFGGRVEGRNNTDFAGCRGTIIDVIDVNDDDRYLIQW